MTNKDVLYERINHYVGEKIRVTKFTKGDSMQQVEAEIVGIYQHHVMVQDVKEPKYRWCVMWVDLVGRTI